MLVHARQMLADDMASNLTSYYDSLHLHFAGRSAHRRAHAAAQHEESRIVTQQFQCVREAQREANRKAHSDRMRRLRASF